MTNTNVDCETIYVGHMVHGRIHEVHIIKQICVLLEISLHDDGKKYSLQWLRVSELCWTDSSEWTMYYFRLNFDPWNYRYENFKTTQVTKYVKEQKLGCMIFLNFYDLSKD